MTIKSVIIFLVAVSTTGICTAQSNTTAVLEDFKPSVLNQPGQLYPQVNSQRYARFRIRAPHADSVKVSLGGRGGTLLTKADSGFFIGTSAVPLDEGFH